MLSMAPAVMARGLAPAGRRRQVTAVSFPAVRVPCFEHGGFFVRRETGQRDVRAGMPSERVAGGLLDTARRGSGLARRGGIVGEKAGEFRQRLPYRERTRTVPAPYVLRLEEVLVDPGERAVGADRARTSREKLTARERHADAVTTADSARFGAAHEPAREIAHIDELDEVIRCARRQHLAPARKSRGPIGEAPGRVFRADDQPRAADECVGADRLLARHFGVAIGLEG